MIRTAVLLAILATPAHALSCLPPDPVRLFQRIDESPDRYAMVKGRIIAEDVKLPDQNSKVPARTTVRIEGHGLGRDGFTAPVSGPVTLELICLSVWCASAPSGDEQIMAIDLEGNTLTIDPCGGDAVAWSADGEERLLDCVLNGVCEVPDF